MLSQSIRSDEKGNIETERAKGFHSDMIFKDGLFQMSEGEIYDENSDDQEEKRYGRR